MRNLILFFALLSSFVFFGQRTVFPTQDIINPHLSDPSFIGEDKRGEVMAMAQVSDSKRKQFSQYLNAQFPVYQNVSFGFDYFKDGYDFYSYSTAMVSGAIKFGFGNVRHYMKLGVSGGIDTRKQDRVPEWQLPADDNFVPNINNANTDFVYRAGLHYTNKNLSLGGFYNKMPVQNIVLREASEDELHYLVDFGYTAYVQYGINMFESFRVTPIFRYLSYTDEPIYEGALRVDVKNWVSASVSYKNDYSINPAVRFRFFDVLQLGYSYEKAIGAMAFDDVHALSISYLFKKRSGEDGEEEPEWMGNAKKNIEKVEAIKKPKPKEEKEPEVLPDPVIEEKAETEQEEVKTRPEKTKPNLVVVGMSPRYYVIAGSFDTIEAAYLFKSELSEKGHRSVLGKTDTSKKYYVYIDSDANENRASKRLEAQKSNSIFKDAWLLEVPK